MKSIVCSLLLLSLSSCVSTENRPEIIDDQFQFSQSLGMPQARVMRDMPKDMSIEKGRDHRGLPHFYARIPDRTLVIEMYGPESNVKLASLKRFMQKSEKKVNIVLFHRFVQNIAPSCTNACLKSLFHSSKYFEDRTVYSGNRKLYVDWESRSGSLQVTITPEKK